MERLGSGRPAGAQAGLRLPERLRPLVQRRIDVVGVASVEGGEMARYLLAAGFSQVVGHDRQPDLDALGRAHDLAHAGLPREERGRRLAELLQGLSALHLGEDYLSGIEDSGLLIPTQAWFLSPANRRLRQLSRSGRPFYSLVQAYLELAPGRVVGVTGSHGKSTTTWLLAAILRASRQYPEVWLAGNDRHSLQCLMEVARVGAEGCLVLEISNRQLLQMDRAPEVACITNITPNHLEEHGGMAGYIAAKRRIFDLPGCRVAVRNGDDEVSLQTGGLAEGMRELRFGASREALGDGDGCCPDGAWLAIRTGATWHPVVETARVPLRGEHNLANAAAALTLVAALLPPELQLLARAKQAIEAFRPLGHRTELVLSRGGVEYIDDLSSTTPQSTVAALRALGRPSILIAGGEDKGIGFGPLAELAGDPLKALVLLPGRGSEKLGEAFQAAGQSHLVHRRDHLLEAVELARDLAHEGDAVLLSPACPGFFSAHYGEGGFRQAVRRATSPRPRREPA